MDRCEIFQILTSVAAGIGTVRAANMHNKDCMHIEGTTVDGKVFSVSLHVKEKEENQNA